MGAPRNSTSWAHARPSALVAVEEDTVAMAKLLLMSLVAKSCKIVIGLLVGEEVNQTQEFTMYAPMLPDVDMALADQGSLRVSSATLTTLIASSRSPLPTRYATLLYSAPFRIFFQGGGIYIYI